MDSGDTIFSDKPGHQAFQDGWETQELMGELCEIFGMNS